MEALNTGARGLAEINAVAAVISAAQGKGSGDGSCHCNRGVGADGVMGKGSFVDWCHVLQVLVLLYTSAEPAAQNYAVRIRTMPTKKQPLISVCFRILLNYDFPRAR